VRAYSLRCGLSDTPERRGALLGSQRNAESIGYRGQVRVSIGLMAICDRVSDHKQVRKNFRFVAH